MTAIARSDEAFSPRNGAPLAGEPAPNRPALDRYLLPIQLGLLFAMIAAWQISATYLGTGLWTSSPTGVIDQFGKWIEAGVLWPSFRVTLIETMVGFVAGASLGAVAGFTLGWMKRLGKVIEPFILALYTLPKIALAPLFVLWFGIGMMTKIMLSGFLVFFFVFFTTFQGMKNIDHELVDISRVMGLGKFEVMRKVVLPQATVWVFSGLRIALPYAVIGAVVGEFIAAQEGIGYLIKAASSLMNTSGVFAGLIILMAGTTILSTALRAAEAWVLRWREAGDSH